MSPHSVIHALALIFFLAALFAQIHALRAEGISEGAGASDEEMGIEEEREEQDESEETEDIPAPAAQGTFRILDKITGRVQEQTIATGESRRFDNLEIFLHYCRANPPEERPEIVAFLQVFHYKSGALEPSLVFSGWMFASSPSVNALEHPVYDVWPIACKTSSGEASAPNA